MRTDATYNGGFDRSGLSTGSWFLVSATWDTSDHQLRVFLNGVQLAQTILNGSHLFDGTGDAGYLNEPTIGNIPQGGRDYNGQMQEVRLSKIARSSCWFKTEYNNQKSPSTFYSIGPEEGDTNIYTITASSGINGSLSPSGVIGISEGESKTFTITPSDGYQIDEVLIDGVPIALAGDQYEFSNVTQDHTISVSFAAILIDPGDDGDDIIAGCASNVTADYSAGFNAADLTLINTEVTDGKIMLNTGNQSIDPNNIVIPFAQEVSVTFLYEGAGYKLSDFGWMLAKDGKTATRHEIYQDVNDNDKNGVLDLSPSDSSNRFGDTNGDGVVDAKDNRKVIGTFAGGTELAFYLDVDDKDYTYYTKEQWNPDFYDSEKDECDDDYNWSFTKTFYLGRPNNSEGKCLLESNWMGQVAIDRAQNLFDLQFGWDDTATLEITYDENFSHVVAGAPGNKPNEWILGWEDLWGGGDTDHNDLIFKIERQTGGLAQLESSKAIKPDHTDAYFTGVTLEVYDRIPCAGLTDITYYLSIDNGANWVEVTSWDEFYTYTLGADGSKIIGDKVNDWNWSPGSPEYTYRTIRIDFAGLGLTGRELIWKAELKSQQQACEPEIVDVFIDASVASHGFFSRSSPVVKGNVLYSGSYETPAMGWTDTALRGHLKATRIYHPSNPGLTSEQELWDAGEVLSTKSPSSRTIYFPNDNVVQVTDEAIATGDGVTLSFSGTLAHHPVSATTLHIDDSHETFQDIHVDQLKGSLGGSGTINRFTGEFTVTFNSAPGDGVPIKASYSYYTTSNILLSFTSANITNSMLGLDDSYQIPDGYIYDLDNDGDFDENDGDWLVGWVRGYKDGSTTPKDWPLGPIDHSTPAVQTPPGVPLWFIGTAISEAEREDYTAYKESHADRPTVIYVGSRSGMLHAFDAGKFRWGDNQQTVGIEEKRGYFLWEDRTFNYPAYCSSSPSSCPNYGTGEELWAFIPANQFPRLKNNLLNGDDQAYVDASPALADVYTNGAWKTVLLAAEGNGGDTIFCLEVTDPYNPTFLWEFADPDLFRSRSSPSVAQIGRILIDDSVRWVAFFVSGKTYDATLFPSIYMIDIADGSVVERIFLDSDASGVGGVPSGQPTVIDSDGNGYIDRIYIGTDKGLLYKVNIPDDPDTVKYGISNCVINRDFTDPDGNSVPVSQRTHPIYGTPVAVVDNDINAEGKISYNVKIFYGTGDSPYYDEDINIAGTRYYFFAYLDQTEKGQCDESAVSLDWYYELPEGHRIFTSAFAAAGNIYFGTSTSETEDPCEGGGRTDSNLGSIFAFDMAGTKLFEKTVGNITVTPYVEDEHLYIKSQTLGLKSFGSGQYNNRTILGGLPEVSVRLWEEIY
jgi:hypothetical protein